MRPMETRTRYGCRRLTRRWLLAVSFTCSCHRAGSGSGTSTSPMSSSSTRSSRPSLLPTCQYSDAAPAPSCSPSRRMLSAASPSRSSSWIAAATIASRLIGSRRFRDERSGSRCHGGAGISASAIRASHGYVKHCTSSRTVFDWTDDRVIERRSRVKHSSSYEGVEMATHTAVADGQAVQAGYPRRWLAAVVMITGALMDMIDVTIVNVALPSIRNDLHASATQLEWVVSGYMLAFAAALIIAGNFGDLLGRKRIYLAGAGVFGLASLGAGLATTPSQLIACRVVQGLAAAAMAPQVLATFRVMFGPKERGKAFSIYGATLGFASAVGLLV